MFYTESQIYHWNIVDILHHYVFNKHKVEKIDTAVLDISDRVHVATRFLLEGFGNVCVMTTPEPDNNFQVSTIVITPFYSQTPVLSIDTVITKDKITFLFENYKLHDNIMEPEYTKVVIPAHTKVFKPKSLWYDKFKGNCQYFTYLCDDTTRKSILENLVRYMQTVILEYFDFVDSNKIDRNEMPKLTKDIYDGTCMYIDGLIEEGVSTAVFVRALGKEKTKDFYRKIFFGIDSINC